MVTIGIQPYIDESCKRIAPFLYCSTVARNYTPSKTKMTWTKTSVRKSSSHSSPAAQKLLEKLAAHAGAETDAATGAHRRRSNRSAHDEDESPKACVPEDAKAWAGSKVHTAPKQPDLDNPYLSKHFVVSTKLER